MKKKSDVVVKEKEKEVKDCGEMMYCFLNTSKGISDTKEGIQAILKKYGFVDQQLSAEKRALMSSCDRDLLNLLESNQAKLVRQQKQIRGNLEAVDSIMGDVNLYEI